MGVLFGIVWTDGGKLRKKSSRISGVSAEILICYLPNTSTECYLYTDLLTRNAMTQKVVFWYNLRGQTLAMKSFNIYVKKKVGVGMRSNFIYCFSKQKPL